jgi:hypothetical protein
MDPIHPNTAVAVETKQELPVMTSMREMPDVPGYQKQLRTGHTYLLAVGLSGSSVRPFALIVTGVETGTCRDRGRGHIVMRETLITAKKAQLRPYFCSIFYLSYLLSIIYNSQGT